MAYEAPDEAVLGSGLSSPCDTLEGGALPIYLSAVHFLGSGVTPVKPRHAEEMLLELEANPAQAVNPAYVAKLRETLLYTEGHPDVMIRLPSCAMTVSRKANNRGQRGVCLRESNTCASADPESDDRCWVFQTEARRDVVPSVLEKLCAAGAVLEASADFENVLQVNDGPAAVVYATPLLPFEQDARKIGMSTDQHEMSGKLFRAAKAYKVLEDKEASRGSSPGVPPEEIARELKMLLLVQKHRSILELHGLVHCPTRWVLLTDWCEGGSLAQDLKTGGPKFEDDARALGKQLFAALLHLHLRGVVHRDVTLEHLLVRTPGELVLGGFSRAAPIAEAKDASEPVGTVGYMAPEVIRYAPALQAADMFSAGVVLYTLLLGVQPFGGATPAEETKYLTACVEADFSSLAQKASARCQSMLHALLEKDPADRPTAAAALEDDWFSPISAGCSQLPEAPRAENTARRPGRRRTGFEMLWRRTRSVSVQLPQWRRRTVSDGSQDLAFDAATKAFSQGTARGSISSRSWAGLRAWLPVRTKRDDMLDCSTLKPI